MYVRVGGEGRVRGRVRVEGGRGGEGKVSGERWESLVLVLKRPLLFCVHKAHTRHKQHPWNAFILTQLGGGCCVFHMYLRHFCKLTPECSWCSCVHLRTYVHTYTGAQMAFDFIADTKATLVV